MLAAAILPLLSLALPASAETVVGVYMFSRHGDRTSKSTPPTNLTNLGYQEVYQSGSYWRTRYVDSNATSKLLGLNSDLVKQSQIAVTAPVDNVLQNSAMGFLQGLYPPVGTNIVQTLNNDSTVAAPLDGYQLIPVNIVTGGTGSGSEDNTWLQDASGCANAKSSSNNYFFSAEYQEKLSSTGDFYTNLYPVVNRTFAQDYMSFKNAYAIYDLINVATIDNASSTIQSADLLTSDTLFQLRTLADAHEFGLAYNASDNTRAISGMQLAGEVLTYLNKTISTRGANKLGIQFGAYATFLSFFGLSNLTSSHTELTGVPDYASSMAFELYTDSDTTLFPSADQLRVRFMFANGSASESNPPTMYPLFGGSDNSTSWNDFSEKLSAFAVSNAEQWCTTCGNTTGACAAYAGSNAQNADGEKNGSGSGISNVVAGVIGAMVTLAVIFGLEALALVLGGLRVVSKKRIAGKGGVSPIGSSEAVKA